MDTMFFRWRIGSDTYPCEVIKKCTDNKYLVREMDFDVVSIEGDCDNYKSVESNPIITIRKHKNGLFYQTGTNYCPFFPSSKPIAYRDMGF